MCGTNATRVYQWVNAVHITARALRHRSVARGWVWEKDISAMCVIDNTYLSNFSISLCVCDTCVSCVCVCVYDGVFFCVCV